MRDFLYKLYLKIYRFMYGRNGQDELTLLFYFVGFVLLIAASITHSAGLCILTMMSWGYSIFRTLSKNILRRQSENLRLLRLLDRTKSKVGVAKTKWDNRKTHKYFRCKVCKQIIRVPRGKGRIEITCPRCNNTFIKRT